MTTANRAETWRRSADALAADYAAGSLSPVEVLAEVYRRIERLNPTLNAVVATDPAAEAAARASEARWRRGAALSPLDGVPLTVKDNLLAAGLPATWGSRLFQDYWPDADELPVARLRAAGAVIVAKTNAPELTLEGYTWNPVFGVTRNPWDPALTPGGSSGGAVAAVAAGLAPLALGTDGGGSIRRPAAPTAPAAGLAPLALGTDGGGSIRRPAAHTGLVGMKPSIGWAARRDGFPSLLLDMEVVGPIARSVRDAALMLDILAGPDRGDRKSLFAPAERTIAARLTEPLPPRRILYVRQFDDHPLDPAVAAGVDTAAETLAALGHRVEAGPLPFDVAALNEAWPLIGEVGVAHLLRRHPEGRRRLSEKFVAMAERGEALPASRHLELLELIEAFRRAVAETFAAVDAIVTPTAAALPWPAEVPFPETIDGQRVGPRGHAIYTGWVNACGHPGVSLPGPPSSTGLPIGVQVVGDFGADAELLRLAAAYERAAPWRARWPTLALA